MFGTGFLRMARAMALSCLLSILSGGTLAQVSAISGPDLNQIAYLADSDPAAALAEIERVLAALAAAKATDPRVVYDLNLLAADLLARQGRAAEAAVLFESVGQFAARNRDRLGIDPVPIWRDAVGQFLATQDFSGALRVEQAILSDQRDGGLPPEVLAATLRRMADLARRSGDDAGAAASRDAAEAALKPADPNISRGPGEGFARVEVFYATDRARTGNPNPDSFYGAGRGLIDYGVAEVTVPDAHVPGAIEAPSIWRLEFGPSPTKHVTLRSVEPVDEAAFFTRMQKRMVERTRKEIFVFIHGYNVSFDSAAKRAAQLAYDMNYVGVPVLYSWPSRGSTMGYIPDTAVVQLSARRLSHFLDDLVARSGATTINIVAHSMGNRALTEALELMALRHGQTAGMPPVFDQIVFAAPDVDAGLFVEMLPTIRPLASRLTLYASENDWALATSRKLHGDAPRAGQGGADTLSSPLIDSVDMSELGEDMLAHSYFADDNSALVDLVALFWRNLAPDRRCGLERVPAKGGLATWHYVLGVCPDNALLAVIGGLQQDGVATADEASVAIARTLPDADLKRRVEPVVMRMLDLTAP